MALGDDLERIAVAAAEHGAVSGVLAAEPGRGRRLYLIAFGGDEDREWLVDDTREGPSETSPAAGHSSASCNNATPVSISPLAAKQCALMRLSSLTCSCEYSCAARLIKNARNKGWYS